MKRPLVALAALALGIRAALAADASVALYVFDQQLPLAGAEVRVDGEARATTDRDGAARLILAPGTRRIVVLRDGAEVLTLELEAREDEQGEIIATLYPDSAPSVFVESSHGESGQVAGAAPAADLGPPGVLEGRILGSEDGQPVEGARVYVSGTPLDIRTDAEGRFRAELPPGAYTVSVIAADFATQTIDGVAIASEQATTRDVELTPAGMELPEFVVLEPYVEGSLASFVEEKRTSSAVTDVLGAEQISRAGDSDAAGALKRVTGLTLVDGRFIYVRGLGERYSSTLLNGAQVPSPDPTRRVVPLDLFPTELLSGIVVQKTYSANMPGEFGGGTVELRTRGVPDSFLLRVQGTVGYAQGTTGDDGLRYDGGDEDWTGRDDGPRAAPEGLLDGRLTSDQAERERLGEELAAGGYTTRRDSLGPDGGFSVALGDDFSFADGAWSLGYISAFRYSHGWENREESRAEIGGSLDNLRAISTTDRSKTTRSIDTSAFLALGLEVGERHRVDATLMQVRQSRDEAQVDDRAESGDFERLYELEWVENELQVAQLSGEHAWPSLGNLLTSWQHTRASAGRDSPNARDYRFVFNDQLDEYVFAFSNQQRFEQLEDESEETRLDLQLPLEFAGDRRLQLQGGLSVLRKERESFIRRFTFAGPRPGNILDLEDLLTPPNIGPGGQTLRETTQAADAYTAEVDLDAWYLAADLQWGALRASLGARQEDILQQVVTVAPFDPNAEPVIGLVDESNLLPSLALTWAYSPSAQLRFGYGETLSRPDIREQSEANFIDPLLDTRVVGNPDLVQAEIANTDLRWEYYFSPTESFSVALFQKDFTNPIELVNFPGTGELLTLRNANEATNRGIEFDVYKSLSFVDAWDALPGWLGGLPWQDVFVGANYARIDSEIDLGEDSGNVTNAVRPLQGQSSYVANLSLSYLHPEGDVEASLLYNVSGPRISRAGFSGIPDEIEQPFDQLDFTLAAKLPWDGWKLKLRLRNLLDPEAEFTVGGLPSRSFRKGREAALSVEWRY